MPTASLTSKGQITIPKSVRDRLRINAGDQVDFVVNEHGDVVVRGVSVDIRDIKGILKRQRKRAVTVEEMNEAIQRAHTRKR